MTFSSFVFIWGFLPVVLIGFWLFRKHGSNLFLLAASLFFYAWGAPKYVVLLLFSICLTYFGGLAIAAVDKPFHKKIVAISTILIDLAMLGYFKYYNFAAESFNTICQNNLIPLRSIGLPIGISFYTFRAISYIVDLMRGESPVQKSPIKLALFLSFFPQLIAGPISKYKDIAQQLDQRVLSLNQSAKGLQRFCFGLGKKVIVSNSLGNVVEEIMALESFGWSSLSAWIAAVFYTLQIYYDFSGYSDMAIGLANVFGFSIRENFDYPYVSTSIREFWRRWHISLSTWFKDYLYIPLGGSRKGTIRTIVNFLVVFFATGLWHGAQWHFVLWGLYHGCLIIIERLFLSKFLDRHHNISRVYVMLSVTVGLVFFMSPNMATAMLLLKQMFLLQPGGNWTLTELVSTRTALIFVYSVLFCGDAQRWFGILLNRYNVGSSTTKQGIAYLWALVVALTSLILMANEIHNPFIYFQF